MILGDLLAEIRDLGFESDAAMAESRALILNAINRAIRLINTTVRPILGFLDVEHPGGLERYDIPELVGPDVYESIYGQVKRAGTDDLARYFIERRNVVGLEDEPGMYRVEYRRRPERITIDTPNEFEIELDFDVCPLLPLLASYFIWLDDDERKAVMYWNNYDDLKNQILGSTGDTLRAVVTAPGEVTRGAFDEWLS
jgi:hypothetical protein